MAKGTPLEGDHGAFDDLNHASKHSKGVKDGMPTIHNPWPASSGQAPVSDGIRYVATSVATEVELTAAIAAHVAADNPHNGDTRIVTIFTFEGALSVEQGVLRIYNLYNSNRQISKVFISVNTAPTGASIIVDVQVDGTSIFSAQGNMPTITASSYTGYSTTIQNHTWSMNSYLQFEVEQIGSTIAGSDLTVHVVHEPHAETVDTSPAYTKGVDTDSDAQTSYAKGKSSGSDSTTSYTKGQTTGSDPSPAFTQGV